MLDYRFKIKIPKFRKPLSRRAVFLYPLIFILVFGWVFSGQFKLFPNLPFPPEIKELQAAVGGAHLTTGGSTTAASSYTTASISPSANNLVLAWVIGDSFAANIPTLSGNNLTWVRIRTTLFNTSQRLHLFRAMGSSPTAGTVSINFGAAMTGCAWSISQYSNVDTSGTAGSGAIVQIKAASSTAATSLNVPLSVLQSSLNATAGGFGINLNSAAITAGSGYSRLGQFNFNLPATDIMSEWRADGQTTVNVTNSSGNIGGIAVEIKQKDSSPPANASSLGQYKADGTTVIANGVWTTENQVNLYATSTNTSGAPITIYYNLATTSGSFITSTTTPSGACSSGTAYASCPGRVWYSSKAVKASITSIPDFDGYKWRALACDSNGCSKNWTAFNATVPNFKVDNTAPVFADTFHRLASTTISIKLGFPSAVTEAYFSEYKIYYKIGSTTSIHETDNLIGSTTLAILGSQTFGGESSTTISDIATGTVYSFSLWAYDQVGHKASSTLMWERTDRSPTVIFNSAAQRIDGTGRVDISFSVDDIDKENQMMARIDYAIGATCDFSSPYDPTLDEADANTTASQGDPKVQNKNAYQIGTSTGWILTTGGTNTVNFDWLSAADLDGQEGTYCLRVSVSDNRGGWKTATTSVYLDNNNPTAPGPLTLNKRTLTSITANLGATTTEPNFFQYKIFYKTGASGVEETDTLFGSSTSPGDAALGSKIFLSQATTTFTGLISSTQYVFNIWAYDTYGNKASGTVEFSTSTKSLPPVPAGLEQYLADGITAIANGNFIDQNEVNLYATATDSDIDPITIYYQLATTSGVFITATATPGDPCSSGTAYASCPSRVWYSSKSIKANIKSIPNSSSGYKWQTLSCDSDGCSKTWTIFNASVPNFKIDDIPPSTPASLTPIASSTTSIKLGYPAAVTEDNFYQYKIYYKIGSTTQIYETDSLWGSSSDANLASRTFNSKSSTTITGLATGTVYSFSLWAYDYAGNKSSSTLVWERTDRIPITVFNSAAERVDGTGRVDISVTFDDLDKDGQLRAELEYFSGSSCTGTAFDPTLDEDGGNISATYGTPVIQNKNIYQIGTSTGYILTSSGANTVNFDWLSASDLSGQEGTYCLKITAIDSVGAKQIATTSLVVDNKAPAGLGSLTANKESYGTITFNFGSSVTETNFSQYKIFYKTGASGVTEGDNAFTQANDPALGSKAYLSHATSAVSNLLSGTQYVFNIWAYDTYGNKAYAAAEFSTSTLVVPSYTAFNLFQYRSSTSTLLANGSWTNEAEVNLIATSSGVNDYAIFYEVIDSSGTFTTATSEPADACSSGTAYGSCSGYIWKNKSPAWYNADYSYRTKITTKNSQVNADLTSFPVYFDLARLGTANAFWSHTKKDSSGGDLLVTDANGIRLPLEVVSISTSTKTGEIYFLASNIYDAVDTNFYLYYGSSTATQPAVASAYGRNAVWSNEYVSVWHLKETSGNAVDSRGVHSATGNGTLPSATTGKFGVGQNFNNASYFQTDSNELQSTAINNYTISAWFRAAATDYAHHLVWEGDSAGNGWGTNAETNVSIGQYTTSGQANQLSSWLGYNVEGTAANAIALGVAFTDTTNWNYVTFVVSNISSAPAGEMFLNGASQGTDTGATANMTRTGWNTNMRFGRSGTADRYFNGVMDEIRIASTTRSSGWISTEYNNQNNPSAFFSTSSEGSYLNGKDFINIPTIPNGSYKWQVLVCDIDGCSDNWTVFNATVPNFNVDITTPSTPNPFTAISSSTTAIKLGFPAAVTETNFRQYKIYYKIGSTTAIHETDMLWGSSSDANLSSRTFNGKSSTTITGLATGTVYSFSLWAYDYAGNKSSSTLMWERADRIPTVAFNSAGQRVDGSGRVNVSFIVDDLDKDNQLMARVDYVAGATCDFSTPSDPTLDETDANTSASQGDPKVQNKNTYQIGTSTGWIITGSGANTVDFDWLSATDLDDQYGTYCLRLIVNDNKGAMAIATTTLYVDNKEPSDFGPLTLNKKDDDSVTVNFGSSVTEINFRQYKIYYKAGSSGVKETDTLFGSSTSPGDAALASQTFLSHTTTTVSGLSPSTQYVFNIFAYDLYGNKASSTSEFSTYTESDTNLPINPIYLVQYHSDGTSVLSNGDWVAADNVYLYATSSAILNPITIYYQLATTSGTFLAATDTPSDACPSGTAWASCPSRIWYADKANIASIPDNDYKWQALACNVAGCSRGWTVYDVATPNFKVDATAPSGFGPLTLNKKTYDSIYINFGSSATETNFRQYKIFYKEGTSGVHETDTLFGSSTSPGDAALASQTFLSHTTTTITGLTPGTQYVFNIWAYDLAGNKASGTTEFSTSTRNIPATASSLNQYRSDGITSVSNNTWINENEINLYATSTDADGDAVAIYYQLATTSGTFITATSVPGNACSSGTAYAYCPSRVWYSNKAIKADIVSIPDDQYKWQALACAADGCSKIWTAFNGAIPNIKIDITVPSTPNQFTVISSSTTAIKLGYPAAVTEDNFYQYKIYYKTGSTTAIHETDNMIGSSTVSALSSRTFNGKSSTTITGLATGTVYSFSLWAYDEVGNKSSSTFVWERTDRSPTAIFNSAAQRLDGLGLVDISVAVDDLDDDDQIIARLEYFSGAACTGTTSQATLDEADYNTTATHGDPKVQNKNAYQIGTSSGYILTSSGANTIDFDWLSATDLSDQDETYCIKLIVIDNRGGITIATTTLAVDNKAPVAPGSLTVGEESYNNLTLTFGSPAEETNFSQYKIYYKIGASGVTEIDDIFDQGDDSALGSISYLSHTTTNIGGLLVNTQYVFNIWAYDIYGNKSYAAAEFSTSTRSVSGYLVYNLEQYRISTSSVLANGGWTNEAEVNVTATSTSLTENDYTIFYEVIENSGTFTTATSEPADTCSSGTAYDSCSSHIWRNKFSGWYDTDYPYRAQITVNNTQVDGNFTSFPVYFDLARLGTSHSFWSHTQGDSSGGDLLVTDSLGNRLPLEVVFVSVSGQTGEIHFKAANLYDTSDTIFYLYYGSSTASQPAVTDTYGRDAVWSNGFGAVYHMNEDVTDEGTQASAHVNSQGTAARDWDQSGNSRSNGIVGYAQDFDGNDMMTETDDYFNQTFSTRVIGLWYKADSITGTNKMVLYEEGGPTAGLDTYIYDSDLYVCRTQSSQCYYFNVTTDTTDWHYVVNLFNNGSAGHAMYYDGSIVSSSTVSSDMASHANEPGIGGVNSYAFYHDQTYNNGTYFDGRIDEVRVSDSVRSSAWISTEYNNLSDNSVFFSTSSESAYYNGEDFVNIPTIPDGDYKWQAIVCDINGCADSWTAFNASTPNFRVDVISPSAPSPFSSLASTTNSIKLGFPAAVTEDNFRQYKIYYRVGSTTQIHETDMLWGSSSDANLASRTFNSKSSTTITGLATGTVYSFSLWAYDYAGNKSSSTLMWERADRNPTAIFNSAAEQINGTGAVNVSAVFNDLDKDTLKARVEYFANAGCTGIPNKATLDETDANTSASQGDPKVQNKNTYQIGTSTGYILTDSGANTVNFVWNSKTDIPTANNTYCLKIIAIDSRGGLASSTTTLFVDNTSPSGFGPLTLNKKNDNSITANFGSSATETNFRQYKIYYKVGSPGVKETDTLFGSSTTPGDAALNSQTFLSHTTTTITGLYSSTTYAFNLFAYDLYGNKASSTSEFSTATKHFPANPSSLVQYRSDGAAVMANGAYTNISSVYFSATSTDLDNDSLTLYYQLASTSGTYITATTAPANACASGTAWTSCQSRVWYSKKPGIISIPDNIYKWQVLACDIDGCSRDWTAYNASTPNFTVDTIAPSAPGPVTPIASSTTYIKLQYDGQTSDTNFRQYKIYYKEGVGGTIHETDMLWGSSSDANLSSQTFNGKSSTTVTGLILNTTYSFSLWAYDWAGNKSSSSLTWEKTQDILAVIFNSASERIDGTGRVDISMQVNDPEDNDQLRVKIEYFQGATCEGSSGDPTLDETDGNTTATHGDPKVQNKNEYQIGTSTGWILSSLGANIVNFDWLSATDLPDGDDTYCLLATLFDGVDRFASSTITLTIDNVTPSEPGALTLSKIDNTNITPIFGPASTETNFRQYKIYYKIGANGASETDSLFGSSTVPGDSALSSRTYLSHTTTTITGLFSNTQYVFNIWAYDQYGHKASATSEFSETTKNFPANPGSLGQYKADGTTVITNGYWTNEDEVNLYATSTDPDDDAVIIYYQLATTSGTFITSTSSAPTNSCSSGTAYASCPSRVWYSNGSTKANITSIPDSVGYKWQTLACDIDGCSRNWAAFNATIPNFRLDATSPTAPGALTPIASTTASIKLQYGTPTTEILFAEYKIFYRLGSSTPPSENDSLWGSSSDANLASRTFNSKSSTTITGLATSTWYGFAIFAYDQSGQKANSTYVYERTSRLPAISSFSAAQGADGTGRVDISLAVDDADKESQMAAKLEYFASVDCSGSSLDPTLDETDANTSATYGDPKVQNKNEYQVGTSTGWIITTSGPNTVEFDWLSATDLPDGNGAYCLRITAKDNRGGWTIATTSLTIDNVKPSIPGPLTFNKKSLSGITLNLGATTTETNFAEYRIYYKEGTSGVKETDTLFSSSTTPGDAALGDIDYLDHATTAISDLSPDTTYVFNIFAYDIFGNRASGTVEVSVKTFARPTGIFNSAAQRTDGTGRVDISIAVDDGDDDNTVAAKLEYFADASCHGSPLSPTLDESAANISASTGTVAIENDNVYQVGNAAGYIFTSDGSNTVNFDWLSAADLSDTEGTYCLRLTVNDGTFDQSPVATTSLAIDNIKPTAPGALTFNDKTLSSITLNFGASSTETNFSQYKIYYKVGSSSVTEGDTVFDYNDDAALISISYLNHATTTITGLSSGAQYSFNIFAFDVYGNKASATPYVVAYTSGHPIAPVSMEQYGNSTTTSPLSNNAWLTYGEVNVTSTSTHPDGDDFNIFYEFIDNSGAFTTATSIPSSACESGTSFDGCTSKIWQNKNIPAWYDEDYLYRTQITVNNSQVDANVSDFPVYLDLARLGTSHSFWSNVKSDGGDLIITDSASNRLPLELVSISTSNKTGEVYFRAGNLYNLTDTVFYLYYGSSTASQPGAATVYGSQNVWTNGYRGVWHLSETSGTQIHDSTSYANNSSSMGGSPTLGSSGRMGTGIYFPGSAYFLIPTDNDLEPYKNLVFSLWMNRNTTQNSYAKPVWYGTNGSTPYPVYGIEFDNTSDSDFMGTVSAGGARRYTSNFNSVASAWYDVNVSYDGEVVRMYIDGTEYASTSYSGTISGYDDTNGLGIGDRYQTGQSFAGYIDEVRIASTTRTDGWISTEYNNQNNPSAFFSTSSEIDFIVPSDFIKITSLSEGGYKWQAMACDVSGCSEWSRYNETIPNISVDWTAPTAPGALAALASTTDSIKLSYGASTTEDNFRQYKIYYKIGSTTAIHETDSLWGSSSDANLSAQDFNGKSSTTITGLATGTVYSFSLWAYDYAGNKSSSTLNWERTDRLPTVVFNSAAQRIAGLGRVDVSIEVDDPDKDDQMTARLEYYTDVNCRVGPPGDSTLDETDANTTAAHGDPKVSNSNEYQIGNASGYILTSLGVNTVDFDWFSKTDLPDVENTYCLKIIINDDRGGTQIATTSLTIDNVAPTDFGPLTLNKKTLTSITPDFNAAATETNFYQYKIFYKQGTSGVKETDALFGSSTTPGDAALASQTYLSHTTTTITNLAADTNYVFNIFAYDDYGNRASSSAEFATKTKARPTGTFNSAALKTDGSGRVDISIVADDNDGDNTLIAKLEYFTDAYCRTSPNDPTLDELAANISASTGTVAIENDNVYQVGNASGYIFTSDGVNTVNFDWMAKTDASDIEDTYCLRLTVSDSEYDQAVVATTSVYLDTKAPGPPGDLTVEKKIANGVDLHFGSQSTETNFYRYRLFYRQGGNEVSEADNEKIDSNLDSQNYGGTATTSITNMTPGSWYAANIWAYDTYGNKASATLLNFKINKKPNSPTSLLQQTTNNTNIANGSLIAETSVNFKAYVIDTDSTSTTFYYQVVDDGGSFATATTVPSETCSSGSTFSSCSSGIWEVATTSAPSDWYNSAWLYRKKIILDHAQISGDQTGFPVLISTTSDADLAAKARADGNDIIFTSANGRTPLSFEKEEYVSLTGKMVFWVKTDLYAGEDTYIYVYYGNASQSTDLSSVNVWDDNTVGAWHLAENGTGTRYDSTDNANNATPYGYDGTEKVQAGIIDGADDLNGVNKFLSVLDNASLDITGNITVSGWFNADSFSATSSLETGGYARYQFIGMKWAATGATDCSHDSALDPAAVNPYAGALYGNSSWAVGSFWNVYDTAQSSVYYSTYQYSIDLNKVWGNVAANTEAYVGAYIYSPDARAVDISRGSDDGSQLWVNGHLVSSDCSAHDLTIDEVVTSVNLKQGWNVIIMRVANGASDWAAQWRISSNSSGLYTVANPRVLVDKQAYQLALKGNYLSAFYGTTSVETAISSDNWQYFTLSGNSSQVEVLLNGASIASTTFSSAPIANPQNLRLGNKFDGTLDEIRVEDARRSDGWLLTSYNNQSDPDSFLSLDTEETRTGMGTTNSIISFPDSADGYKWQVMVCDEENACSNWTAFNATTPNFNIDANAPSEPGNLTVVSVTNNSVTLQFGSAAVDPLFEQYKIFYKAGASGVTENDSLFGSSSDSHLAAINYGGFATTAIIGLSSGMQYVFNIWAYDTSGRGTAAAGEISTTTNAEPTASFVSAAERTDGFGRVDISIIADDDNDNDLQAKLEYAAGTSCNFSAPLDPTLDETDYTATSTYGDAKIENDNEYQIGNANGWIITSSGANTVSFDWLTTLDLPTGDNVYCLRLTASDGINEQSVPATTTVVIDNVKPTSPGALMLYEKGATYFILNFGAQTQESNFKEYRIFYKQGIGGATEGGTELADANLDYINYNGAATTTVSDLIPGQQYSFKIYAYDNYGHKSSSTETIYTTDHLPTGVFNSALEKGDGTHVVDVSIDVNDPDGDTVAAKLEYFADISCHTSPLDPTLDTNGANISADYGSPDINNDNTYQVGASSRIITSSGANTVNFDWLSGTDLPDDEGIYCLRLTVNDGRSDQAVVATTSLIIDNAEPQAPGNLQVSRVSGNYVFLSFGAPATDSYFQEYKIFYKVGATTVTQADFPLTANDDPGLGYINFNGKATTAIASLIPLTEYSFNIWTYDFYGNSTSAPAQISTTTLTLSSATWREAEDMVDPTAGVYLGKEQPVRVRISVANVGDWSASGKYKIQYADKTTSCSAISSWNDVPTTTAAEDFVMANSEYFFNGEPTIQRLANTENYLFATGSLVKAPSNQTATTTVSAGYYTELEYDFQATTNASAGQTYCFRVLKDDNVLDAYSQYPELTLSPAPTASFASVLHAVDGSGEEMIGLDVSHPAGYPTQVKLEYVASSSCDFGSPLDPTLDETQSRIIADYGNPNIDNDEVYQLGSTTGNMVITAYGTNTVAFVWPTLNDFYGVDDTYCLRATAYDGYDNQIISATTTLEIDQVKPTPIGDLSFVTKTATSVTISFGTSSSDTHFKEYRIYYKIGDSGVTENDMLWGSSSDQHLQYANYGGATSTTIGDLPSSKQYYFRIWAYDEYGNKASSSGELSVILVSTKEFRGLWRWYQDQYNETPVIPLAGEGVTPSSITVGQVVKLRMGFKEADGLYSYENNIRLQYSTYSDFSTDVNWVGEKSSTTIWNYGEGIDDENDLITTLLLGTTTIKMTHNESGFGTSSVTLPPYSWGEWEFTIHNNGAASGTAYYFRGYDMIVDEPIPILTGREFPSLITSWGELSFNVAGLPGSTATEGVVTSASTTDSSIYFGILNPGNEAIGAQRFTISTNAEWGYSLYAYQTSDFLSNNGSQIYPVTGTNDSPAAWPTIFAPSNFGYHTGDDTLSGSSPSRFAADNTYASFVSNMEEIAYSSIPVTNETFDLVFRVGVGISQPAGDFETEIVYILVPTF